MWEPKKVVLLHPQNDASVAQLVEHLTLNQGVQGSTPCGSTKEKPSIIGRLFVSMICAFKELYYLCPAK